MKALEVKTFAKQSSVKTQQYFYQMIETKSNACYNFLKRDVLPMVLPDGASIDVYPIEELDRLAKDKNAELSNKLAEKKKNPFKALYLGLTQGFAEGGLPLILDIDLLKLPVLERNLVGEAMFLAALYFNCEDV